ncbi:MAG: hypothetical protein ACJ77Y_12585, partial [Chloroflexota bacterium]
MVPVVVRGLAVDAGRRRAAVAFVAVGFVLAAAGFGVAGAAAGFRVVGFAAACPVDVVGLAEDFVVVRRAVAVRRAVEGFAAV